MAIDFPTNTVVLIVATMLGVGAGSWLILSRGLQGMPVAAHLRRRWRRGAALVLVAWLFGLLAFAANPPGGAILSTQVILTFLGFGVLAGILPLLISPFFRQTIRAVPATWPVGIHAIRVFGFFFLALADMRLLPAEFALPAGYGDITVGLLALGAVYLIAQRKSYARALAIGWNGLGLLDFALALITGVLYLGPFAGQVAAAGVSPLYLNYVLIVPSFGVPLFTLLHLYSLFQLLSAPAGAQTQGAGAPIQSPVLPETRLG